MDRQQHGGGGVKVTYIETQFVTSDAAGFKDLVQRLTGRSPTAAAAAAEPALAAPNRPRAGRTAAAAGAATRPQGYHCYQPPAGEVRCQAVAVSGAPPCKEELMQLSMDDDFSDLFYVGASDLWRHGSFNNGGYGDFRC